MSAKGLTREWGEHKVLTWRCCIYLFHAYQERFLDIIFKMLKNKAGFELMPFTVFREIKAES